MVWPRVVCIRTAVRIRGDMFGCVSRTWVSVASPAFESPDKGRKYFLTFFESIFWQVKRGAKAMEINQSTVSRA